MAYNSYTGYQPYFSQYPQVQTPQMVPPSNNNNNNSIIWVQGEAGAKSYLVAPNTTVQLWDSEEQVIYLKSADASGMPSMKILDYKVRETNATTTPAITQTTQGYVTRDEFKAFESKIEKQFQKFSNDSTKGVSVDE